MEKIRTFFRTQPYSLNQDMIKTLLLIGTFKDEVLVSQKLLSTILKVSKTSLNYRITKLVEHGLITKKNKLTDKGQKAIQYFKHWDQTLERKLRAHKIQISVNVTKLPNNFFDVKHKILEPFSNKRYRGLKGQLLGSQILFYSSKKLLIKIPDVFGNSPEEVMSCIHDCIHQVFEVLIQEFPGINFDTYEICKFDSMHVAILNSIIAKTFLLKEGRCFHSSSGLCIDNSHGVPELECEKLDNIAENIELLINYEDLVAENKKLNKLLKQYER